MTQRDDLLALFEDLRGRYGQVLTEFGEDDLYISGDFETAGIIPKDTADAGLELTKPSNVYVDEDGVTHVDVEMGPSA